jgi:hypothetical protein
MTRDEFIASAKLRGLASAKTAMEYAKSKTIFDETDLEDVYRIQTAHDGQDGHNKWRSYQGTKSTKRLKETESHREY